MNTIDADTPPVADLTGLTRAGLWYIYSSTPAFWVRVARGFGVRVEPSEWTEEALGRAEAGAADAVRFVPVPLVTCAAIGLFATWWRPILNGFFITLADEGFVPLVRSAALAPFGHVHSETAAVVLITFTVWLLSFASIVLSFAPVWLAFRHQLRAAAPVVAVALAADVDVPTAAASPALEGYPRIRYAFGKLQSGWRHTR